MGEYGLKEWDLFMSGAVFEQYLTNSRGRTSGSDDQ